MRCGIRAVLRILLCALGFGDVLGGALCFGLYLGFRRGTWEVLWFWIVFGLSVWDLRGALCFGVLEG